MACDILPRLAVQIGRDDVTTWYHIKITHMGLSDISATPRRHIDGRVASNGSTTGHVE